MIESHGTKWVPAAEFMAATAEIQRLREVNERLYREAYWSIKLPGPLKRFSNEARVRARYGL